MAIAAIAMALTLASLSCEPKGTVRCVRVIDGDTIVVDGDEKVRYIGIDTPELAGGGKAGEYLADEATAFNRRLVEEKKSCSSSTGNGGTATGGSWRTSTSGGPW